MHTEVTCSVSGKKMAMPQLQIQIHSAPKLRQKSGRTPLQPKNTPSDPVPRPPSKLKPDKENRIDFATPRKIEIEPILDLSLAEELSAVRKKLERLRLEKEKTEKMLRERDRFLDLQMKEMESRGEAQKQMEIEVDRLYRLKQLHIACLRVSPIQSLREKQQDKKNSGLNSIALELRFDEGSEESVGENEIAENRNSISSESVVKK